MGGKIISCNNTGNVTSMNIYCGGIAGLNKAIITACYSISSVFSTSVSGGIAGNNTVDKIMAGYWSQNTDGNPSLGVGQGFSNGVNEVDGSSMTWTTATSDMNSAILNWNKENQVKCNYHFEQVDGVNNPPALVEDMPDSLT